jgi:hypothetical protein
MPGMTMKEKISFGINLIPPVQSHLRKYFRSLLTQITFISLAVLSHRGAFRDRHGRWERDAVDVAVSLTNDTDADGEVVWS